MVKKEVLVDNTSAMLKVWIEQGCPGPANELLLSVQPYWRVRHDLRVQEGVPMVIDRTIIPVKMRKGVLKTLHSAHQGVYSMILRAEDTVYWPGFVNDIQQARDKCYTCHKIAPSHSSLPLVGPIVPDYHFQHVCMDYFHLNGSNYECLCNKHVYMERRKMDDCVLCERESGMKG